MLEIIDQWWYNDEDGPSIWIWSILKLEIQILIKYKQYIKI